MKVKGIWGVLFILAGIGIFFCWIMSDYAKNWLAWEIGAYACGAAFLGGIGWLVFNTSGKDKKPD